MLFTVIDTETTGLDPENDALVDIAAFDIVDGVISDKPRSSFVFPGCPISPESSAIHHIVADDVRGAPRARDAVPQILLPDRKPIYVAHNSAFDSGFIAPYLDKEAQWICTYKASLRVWPSAPKHSNQALRYWLGLNVDRKIADFSHRALPDAYVTSHLFLKLLEKASVEDMLAWTMSPAKLPTCPIGKEWRGKPWAAVDTGFLKWMVGQQDMEPDYVWNALDELKRRNAVRTTRMGDPAPKKPEPESAQPQLAIPEPPNCKEEYIKLALAAISFGQSYPDLLAWFRDEKPRRVKWGIQDGDADHAAIIRACVARKVELERAA